MCRRTRGHPREVDVADCLYVARRHCEPPGSGWWQQGWAVCLRPVLIGKPAELAGRRGVCTAVARMGKAPGSDVPTVALRIDGTEHEAPVLEVAWPEPTELVEMWLAALRKFMKVPAPRRKRQSAAKQ